MFILNFIEAYSILLLRHQVEIVQFRKAVCFGARTDEPVRDVQQRASSSLQEK
jgi:hypothetical protein